MSGRLNLSISLDQVLTGLAVCPAVVVSNLHVDSRLVEPGDAFVAVPGSQSHGGRYVRSAISRGAAVILHDPVDGELDDVGHGVLTIAVRGLANHLGEIADRAYGAPSASLEVAGITGTNGKTTCAWMYALCRDETAAYLGTLGAGRPPHLAPTTHTTGDVFTVHRYLREFASAGARHVGMEVSSHALDQARIAGVRMPIAAFTNLTRDHLDYHGSMQAYGAAKEKLFQQGGLKHAVINIDDSFGDELAKRLPPSVNRLEVSPSGRPVRSAQFLVGKTVNSQPTGLYIKGDSHLGQFEINARLIGSFNAENLLIVLGMLLSSGVSLADAAERLSTVKAPPGRLEMFEMPNGPIIVVDYAHTPDALEKALKALRQHVRGQLYCVFGCGGDRDAGKRPAMALVATTYADHVVVTDDNPRTEDPDAIVAMICAGLPDASSVMIERNREQAIRQAVRRAGAGDMVLIAGKGHEEVQIVGDRAIHFSDRQVAAHLIGEAA